LKLTSLIGAFGIHATALLPTTRPLISSLLITSSSSEETATTTAMSSSSSNNNNNVNDIPPQKIGFIGCGTIAAAIATGLATQTSIPIQSISVSRRSESKSSLLQQTYPNLITVYDNNQDILQNADILFICVLPEQTSDVLQSLQFNPTKHTIVSLVSTTTLTNLATYTQLPPSQIFKCICLPAVSRHEGVCLLTPKSPHPILLPMLDSLGGVVQAHNETQMNAMMVPTALMGNMYGILQSSRDWLVQNGGTDDGEGISKQDATYLVGKLFWGMMQDAERQCQDNENAFEELIDEQTPGGLNEQGLKNWRELGALESLSVVQDKLFERICGKSDGSLDK